MKLIERFTGEAARLHAAVEPPFGAGFNEEIAAKTETLEVYGSELKDVGPDHCEFRALDARDNIIGSKRVNGY